MVNEFSVDCRAVLESGVRPYLLDAGHEAKGRESLHLKLCQCFEIRSALLDLERMQC